jgi:mono/diheme cytochrome c family protein
MIKRTFKKIAAGLVLASTAGLVFAQTSAPAATDGDAAQIARGAYLARAGDCIACHSAKGGQPYAGGLAISTPMGKIYSTNITPDADTGIGKWTYEEFADLMRYGRTKEGYTVYPAMPYPSYSRMNDADMHDLYAYMMHGVAPVAQANRANEIPWPLSMRFPLAIWRWLFAPKVEPFQAPANSSAEVARGAYLVEGLGHCGSCHTPRGVALQEKAMTNADGTVYLSGGQIIDGWTVPSLRNEHGGGLAAWSEADIVEFLKSGRNQHTASFGAMNEAIVDSTQYLSDQDLKSMAAYLKSLQPHNSDAKVYSYDDTVSKQLFNGETKTPGAEVYVNRCAACHRSNGQGYTKAFPALAGNPVLQTADTTSAIHIVLSGGAQPPTGKAPSFLAMAPYADVLTDQQIADVVTFIQTSWGNQGGKATAEQVAKIRKTAEPLAPSGWVKPTQ